MGQLTLGTRRLHAGLATTTRRIVMIGFMGAGKSTIGRLLADALGWRFADLDDEVARRDGMPVHRIIRQKGLDHFRRRESEIGREVLRRRSIVVSVGGGWPAQPGHMDLLGGDTVSIWLQVGVASALERIAASKLKRPLLQVPDPLRTATDLLADREPYYRRGSFAIETEGRSLDHVLQAVLNSLAASTNGSGSRESEHGKEDVK